MAVDSGQLVVKDGWETKTLEDVCELIKRGVAPKYTEDKINGLCVINQKCIRDHKVNFSLARLHDKNLKSINPERLICLGDVLVNSTGTGTLGRVAQIREEPSHDCTVDTHVTIVRPLPELFHYDFFGYALIKIEEEIINSGEGASGQTELSRAKLQKNFHISFPKSLAEQKQIVALLDQAFTAIDKAQANIETNINNAKELFQSKLNDIFSQTGEGWEERALKEITTKIGSGSTPRGGQASYKESGISLIRSMNVHDEGFTDKKLAFIDDEQANKLKNVTIQEEDVLLNITGASVARCCVVDYDYLPARVNQHVSIIRLKENTLHYQFLHYALTSKANKDLLLGIGEQGATRQAITKVQIENFKIRFPSDIGVQKEIIKSLNIFKDNSIELESLYRAKIKNLEELKKSILQKVFNGELS